MNSKISKVTKNVKMRTAVILGIIGFCCLFFGLQHVSYAQQENDKGQVHILEEFKKQLFDPDADIRISAPLAMYFFDEVALLVNEALTHDNIKIKIKALDIIDDRFDGFKGYQHINFSSCTPILIKFIEESSNNEIVCLSLKALGAISDEDILFPILIKELENSKRKYTWLHALYGLSSFLVKNNFHYQLPDPLINILMEKVNIFNKNDSFDHNVSRKSLDILGQVAIYFKAEHLQKFEKILISSLNDDRRLSALWSLVGLTEKYGHAFLTPYIPSLVKIIRDNEIPPYTKQDSFSLLQKVEKLPPELLRVFKNSLLDENITPFTYEPKNFQSVARLILKESGRDATVEFISQNLHLEDGINSGVEKKMLWALTIFVDVDASIIFNLFKLFISHDTDLAKQLEMAHILTFFKFNKKDFTREIIDKVEAKTQELLRLDLSREDEIILLQIQDRLINDQQDYSLSPEELEGIYSGVSKKLISLLKNEGIHSWQYDEFTLNDFASLSMGIVFGLMLNKEIHFSKEVLQQILSFIIDEKNQEVLLKNNGEAYEGYYLGYPILALYHLQKLNLFPEYQESIAILLNKLNERLFLSMKESGRHNVHAAATGIIILSLSKNLTEAEKNILFEKLNSFFDAGTQSQVAYSSDGYSKDQRDAACRSVLVHCARWLLKRNGETQQDLVLAIKYFSEVLLIIIKETEREGVHGKISGVAPYYFYPTIPFVVSAINYVSQYSNISFAEDINVLWKFLRMRINNNYFMAFEEDLERANKLEASGTRRTGLAFANFAGALSFMALSKQSDWLHRKN